MTQEKVAKKGAPRMKKLVMNIDADLLKSLKFKAVEQETTVTEIVTQAIHDTLKKGGEKKK
jgi:predicted methyltransferase